MCREECTSVPKEVCTTVTKQKCDTLMRYSKLLYSPSVPIIEGKMLFAPLKTIPVPLLAGVENF
jgi:hypothetical protein